MNGEIQIIVPWGQDGNLGKAYNRLMEDVHDWVCFLDHDILHLNPNWYHMCLRAIDAVGHRAGWITGVTNAIACAYQLCPNAPKSQDILQHMAFAKKLHNKNGDRLVMVDAQTKRQWFSGFMILTHKQAWKDSGGFQDGFLGVDNYYHAALARAGYNGYVMPGMYMYHTYRLKSRWNQL